MFTTQTDGKDLKGYILLILKPDVEDYWQLKTCGKLHLI